MFDELLVEDSNEQSAEVNVSPLIDMVFILLIFFIITTNFNRQTGVDVEKPKAQSALYQGQKTILVGITREGSIHVFGRQVDIGRLKHIIASEIEKQPDASVVIVADENAAIGKAVKVMDQCALAGARKVSIAADRE